MTFSLVRVALLAAPLAAAMACAASGSSPPPGDTEAEAGAPPPDASAIDASPPPPAKATTTTTLDLTPLSPKVGQEVTLAVTVSGKSPTGTVQLKDGTTSLGAPIALTGMASTATGSLKTSALAAGPHVLSAVYSGDADDESSTSTTTSIDVTFATVLPFDTGLDGARVALADLAVDPHWTVKSAAGKVLTAFVQTDASGFPGQWLAPSATSKFLSPFMSTIDAASEGPFTYTTTFSLRTGANLGATTLTVRYASDDALNAIQLNGQAVPGVTPGGYGAFTSLVVSGPFVVGTNTISFVSSNASGPTGFRAELDLTAN
jgi:hypothetical protein